MGRLIWDVMVILGIWVVCLAAVAGAIVVIVVCGLSGQWVWVVMVGGVVGFLVARAWPSIREWRRRAKGQCAKCGYSLEGVEEGACPECGERAGAMGER